jgi:hypothetical protein
MNNDDDPHSDEKIRKLYKPTFPTEFWNLTTFQKVHLKTLFLLTTSKIRLLCKQLGLSDDRIQNKVVG